MSITVGLTNMKIERRIGIAQKENLKSVAFETKDIALFVTRHNRLLERLQKAEKTLKELRSEIKYLKEQI